MLLLFWGGGEGGDAAAAVELARALKRRDVAMKLAAYCMTHPDEFAARAEKARLKRNEDYFLISDPEKLWAETGLDRQQFDLIHVHHGRTIPKRTDILPLRRLAGDLPLFITAHGPLPISSITYGGWKSHLSRYVSPVWFRAIVVPSDAKLLEWRAFTPFSRKVVSIPNVVEFFQRQPRAEARRHLGLPEEADIALFCSRLDEDKDPFTFIRAVALLATQKPGILGIMAGSGALADACAALVAELCAPVKLLGYRTDLDVIYSSANVFVQPSRWESFCITLLQAAEMGIPCVASDLRVLRDMYADCDGVRLFPTGDFEACGREMEAAFAEKLRDGKVLRQRYSEDAIVDAHLELWRRAGARK